MRGVIIYDSAYGNTETIADEIGKGLKKLGHDVDKYRVVDASELDVDKYDFMFLGTPNHVGGPTRKVKKFAKNLQSGWSGKPFATFETLFKSEESKPAGASTKLASLLKSGGMRQMVEPGKFIVIGMKGPLDDVAIPRAKEFVKDFSSKLKK